MPPETVNVDSFFARLRPGQMLLPLFESLPDAYFFFKDRDSRFMEASGNFAAMFGLNSVGELIGKTDHDFTPDFLADVFVSDDRMVMESGVPLLNKVELVPTRDSLDWLTTSKIPLYDQNGGVAGLAGVTRRTRDDDVLYRRNPEMHRIVDHVRDHFRSSISLDDLAGIGGISVSSVARRFREAFGLTPMRYLKMTRLNAACRALRETDWPLARIATANGFNDQAGMNRDFRAELNLTPKQYRARFSRNGKGRPNRALQNR